MTFERYREVISKLGEIIDAAKAGVSDDYVRLMKELEDILRQDARDTFKDE